MSQYSNIRYDLDYLIEKTNGEIFQIRDTVEHLLTDNKLIDDAEGRSLVDGLDIIKNLPKFKNENKLVEIIDGSVKELTKFDMSIFYDESLGYTLEEGSLSNLPRLSKLEIACGQHFCQEIKKGSLNNCPILTGMTLFIPGQDAPINWVINIDKDFITEGSPAFKSIDTEGNNISITVTDNGVKATSLANSAMDHMVIAKEITGVPVLETDQLRFNQFLGRKKFLVGESLPEKTQISYFELGDDGNYEKITAEVNLNWFETIDNARTEIDQIEYKNAEAEKIYYCRFEK